VRQPVVQARTRRRASPPAMARRCCACTLAAVPFNKMHGNERIPASAEPDAAAPRPAEIRDAPTALASGSSAEVNEAAAFGPESPVTQPQAEQQQNQAEEENEMIDVHAPHGGLHTWKDFWIHLGTIALGLLIALGLEQGVEYLHHLHQRHQLEASLLAECRINKDRAEANFSGFDDLMKWLLGLHRDIGKML